MGGLWPNLVVAGTTHAGVPTLHRQLDDHPEVFMCPTVGTAFFSRTWDRVEVDPEAFGDAERRFLERFEPGRDRPVRGESSPDYIDHPDAPGRIRETIPDARVLFVLRDPVERAHAWWSLGRHREPEITAFAPFVEREMKREDPRFPGFLSPGRYGTHLERWLDRFDADRIEVVLFDDLVDGSGDALRRVAGFVDVDPAPMTDIAGDRLHDPHRVPRNAVAGWLRTSDRIARIARTVLSEEWRVRLGDEILAERPERPPMEETARDRLAAHYAPEVERAEALVGRKLPELRRTWDRPQGSG